VKNLTNYPEWLRKAILKVPEGEWFTPGRVVVRTNPLTKRGGFSTRNRAGYKKLLRLAKAALNKK
jgi:hypothetical protein